MDLDVYTVIFSRDQKQALDTYLSETKYSSLRKLQINLVEEQKDNWYADIPIRDFCLGIIELKQKGNLLLAKRMTDLGKLQDKAFLSILENIKTEQDRLNAMLSSY